MTRVFKINTEDQPRDKKFQEPTTCINRTRMNK